MKQRGYETDLTDKQWEIIRPFFESKKGQNLVKHNKRDLINGVFYLLKTGCQWRMIPNDFPPSDTIWSFYRRAVAKGSWKLAMDELVKRGELKLVKSLNQVMP